MKNKETYRQELFDYLSDTFGSLATQSEMQDIERIILKQHNSDNWIKIESEEDLPKAFCDYFVCRRLDGEIFIGNFNTANYFKETFVKKYSHYQPIQKPSSPIF